MTGDPLVQGYRHVYLEGMEEASIFVHVAVSDISGKVSVASESSRSHRKDSTSPSFPPGPFLGLGPGIHLSGSLSQSLMWAIGKC